MADNTEKQDFPFPMGDNIATPEGAHEAMRRAAEQIMSIESVTRGRSDETPILIRGQLIIPSDEAFFLIRPLFEAVGHTPRLQHKNGLDEITALPTIFGKAEKSRNTRAILLLIATILSVFSVGVQGELFVPVFAALIAVITGSTAGLGEYAHLAPSPAEWGEAIRMGFFYMAALLGILGAHEMGHYLVARYHKVDVSLPFFIPLPIGILGTMGAVIAMREPAPNRRIQFDIGIAGPIAGLIVTIPVLFIGLSLSEVTTTAEILATLPPEVGTSIIHEGQSLFYLAMKFIVFGQILPSGDLDVWVHPVAFAGWAGILVTSLNLLPLGQLDGGHIMYGLFGEKMHKARQPIIFALVIMAIFGSIRLIAADPSLDGVAADVLQALAALPIPGWAGWWIWIIMINVMLKSHAPVLDEITQLDPRRKAAGVAMLGVFILIFTPIPLIIDSEPLSALIQFIV